MRSSWFLPCFALLLPGVTRAQAEQPVEDIAEISLEELLNAETSVASRTSTNLRETPGIVTVVTREEIVRSGARDLVDVLHLVPGFQFASDLQGSVGVAIRGIWSQEGKVLLLWDGVEMNETLYLTPQFGNHFPIHTIERIEIIRGPGSALYGGYAELGVINIVTRGPKLDGMELMGQAGTMTRSFARANGGFSYGRRYESLGGLEVSLDLFAGEGVQSDRTYVDGYGGSYQLNYENAQSSPTFGNLMLRWQGLEARVLADVYRVREQDGYVERRASPRKNDFRTYSAQLKYDWRPWSGLTITPLVSSKRQLPWNSGGFFGEYVTVPEFYSKIADRHLASVVVSADVAPTVNIVGGADGRIDAAEAISSPGGDYTGINGPFAGNSPTVSYWNLAAFGQALLKTPVANITAGARVENHSQYGASFVPRVGVTKSLDKLHAKLLVSGAFKAPGIENIRLNSEVKSERTRVVEAELGYQLFDNLSVTASAFDIDLNDPIVYTYDVETSEENYSNFPRTGSRGLELELRIRDKWGYATFAYSYTSSEGKNDVELYDVGRPDVLRGLAGHKLTANTSFSLTEHASVSPSLVVLSERFGFLGVEGVAVGRSPPVALANLAVRYEDLLTDGLDVTLSVHNALDQDFRYIQPYGGKGSDHAPVPAPSREVMAQVTYRFGT